MYNKDKVFILPLHLLELAGHSVSCRSVPKLLTPNS